MSATRPWLAQYPKGVPAEIDLEQYRNIVSVLEDSCDRYRSKPAFENMGKVISYDELDRLSYQFACHLLLDLKLKKGDRVAIMMPNLLQYPVAIFGVLRAGLTVVNTNPLYTARELKHQLNDSGAVAIVVVENFANVVQEVIKDTPVQHAAAALAGLSVGVTRHAVDAALVCHAQHVGRLLGGGVDHLLAEILGSQLQHVGPQLAVFDEEPGLHLIARADPLVIARALLGRAPHAGIGGGPRPADLARLLGHLQAAVIVDPARLRGQEDRLGIGGDDAGRAHVTPRPASVGQWP